MTTAKRHRFHWKRRVNGAVVTQWNDSQSNASFLLSEPALFVSCLVAFACLWRIKSMACCLMTGEVVGTVVFPFSDTLERLAVSMITVQLDSRSGNLVVREPAWSLKLWSNALVVLTVNLLSGTLTRGCLQLNPLSLTAIKVPDLIFKCIRSTLKKPLQSALNTHTHSFSFLLFRDLPRPRLLLCSIYSMCYNIKSFRMCCLRAHCQLDTVTPLWLLSNRTAENVIKSRL